MKSQRKKYPKFASWFLKNFLPEQEQKFVIGDLKEIYVNTAEEKGTVSARLFFYTFIFKSLPHFIKNNIVWRIHMFLNYLKTSIRNMKRQKVFSFINIFGLAIGMTCCILITLWVYDELNYDRFHKNLDRIYRIVDGPPVGIDQEMSALTSPPMAPALEKDYPEIITSARFHDGNPTLVKYGDKGFYEAWFCAADPEFFEIFSFEFIKGDPKTAFNDPHSIVLPEKTVKKYFGDEDPMGKILNIDNSFNVTVTGVIKNPPHNSTIQFDLLSPFGALFFGEDRMNNWNANFHYTFVLLQKGASAAELDKKISDYLIKRNLEEKNTLSLQWFGDTHLHSKHEHELQGLGDIKYVYICSILAVFILLIACINFINLTTARSGNRAREVGMRKVIGANRLNLVKQFFGESVLMTIFAFFTAVVLSFLLLPQFNELTQKSISLQSLNAGFLFCVFFGTAILTGIISGLYPAFFLSSFQPVKVLKGTVAAGVKGKIFRKILVIAQFALSALLIICTLTVSRQLKFLRNKDIGYNKNNLLVFRSFEEMNPDFKAFKNELLQNPAVLSVTRSFSLPNRIASSPGFPDYEGKEEGDDWRIRADFVDYDYFETFGMEIIQGRSFSEKFRSEESSEYIVNETAVKRMGMTDPIGKRFAFWENEGKIVGVVKDFHFRSLHYKIEPIVFRRLEEWYGRIIIKINKSNSDYLLKAVERIWKKHYPKYPFDCRYFDNMFGFMYRTEERMGNLVDYATALAIFIASLGLFGLSAFIAEKRTKEIGIRKVLGSSISGIVVKLSGDFIRWIVIANIIVWPVGWFAMKKWLEGFAFSININIYIFVFSGLISLFIALATVSYHTVKAALSNPVDSIRYE